MKNNNPLEVAFKLKKQRYPDAIVAFAAGSIFRGEGSPTSDIDFIVLYDDPFDDVKRDTYEFEGWTVEVFVHTIQAQDYFFEQDRKLGIPSMMNMIHEGIEIPNPCEFSQRQKAKAKYLLDLGPESLNDVQIQRARYFLTSLLDDLDGVAKQEERYAILSKIYLELADFYLRANKQWSGMGKGVMRALNRYSPEIAREYLAAFGLAFQGKSNESLNICAEKILQPFGGKLTCYEEKAGPDWKVFSSE